MRSFKVELGKDDSGPTKFVISEDRDYCVGTLEAGVEVNPGNLVFAPYVATEFTGTDLRTLADLLEAEVL